jgi:asparagine synthase (glutamine-hydrolysing)
MIDILAHRGPDGNGILADDVVGLAHARLSIIDLGGGHQPMTITSARGGDLAITFNGEIFNYVELRAELESLGRHCKTKSDTEVLLHAYDVWGDACLQKLNGQWAFAIHDVARGRLFCARDRVGVRPFFYTEHDGDLLFASEVKALFAAGAPATLDVRGLHEVATFWCTIAPRTVWRNVHELPPGSVLVVDDLRSRSASRPPRLHTRRWFTLDYAIDESLRDDDECADALRAALENAAHLRLRADVPVGAYVSGGLDSAVVAGLVAKKSDTPLETFSISFSDPDLDESNYQQDVVTALGTKHRTLRCTNADVGRAFADAVWHMETPVLRTAPAPMMLLAGLVREHGYKVVLTGEGADEMFGGYDLFKEAKIRRFWSRDPRSRRRPLLLRRLYPYMKQLQSQPDAYLRAFFHVDERDVADPLFSHLPRFRLGQQLTSLLSAGARVLIADHDPLADVRARLPERFASWDPFSQSQWLESAILLPGYILASQGDRVAMARSVEGRFPFLDANVIALAARLPPEQKMKVLDEKHALKRAAKSLVPASVLARKKQPYRAPDAAAFFSEDRPEWVDDLVSTKSVRRSGLFDEPAVSRLIDKAKKGAALSARDNMAVVFVLSTLLLVEKMQRTFRGKS